ncbi:HAD-IA family hydrolase [Sphingomonas sp. dw_22]|uniref:HAD-IA family hydrolase n=1 Tax=Sphingomonas sp. dw_22 TaxID=2721175 RepID=UPI001BD68E18|nr:HAD-IA family hydrolase [Sphingomonas sp. dw_22]
MAGFPFDIVGFDLDGTLLDTSADLTDALNHALSLVDRGPLGVAEVMPMVGRGTRYMLERGLKATGGYDDELLARLYPELIDYYRANIARGTRPYPGLTGALDALKSRGVTLAIVTNKPESLAVKLIGELGLTERFRTVIGGDTMGPGNAKPSAAPILEMIRRCGGGRAAFVGDSIFDIEAGRNAGIPSVAVSFGFLTQPVAELGADVVVNHFDALVPALERLRADT